MAKFIVNAGEVIDHDGKVYHEGDTIELTNAQAKELAKKVTAGKGAAKDAPKTDGNENPGNDGNAGNDGEGNDGEDDLEKKVANLVKNYKLDELKAKAAELQIEFTEEATKKDLANLIALKEAA